MKKVKFKKRLLGLSISLSAATGRRRQQIWTNEKRAQRGVPPISSKEKRAWGRGAANFVQWEHCGLRWQRTLTNGARGGSQSIHSHFTKIEVITQKILEMNSREDGRRLRRINKTILEEDDRRRGSKESADYSWCYRCSDKLWA